MTIDNRNRPKQIQIEVTKEERDRFKKMAKHKAESMGLRFMGVGPMLRLLALEYGEENGL